MNILYTLNSGKPGGMEQHTLDLVHGMVKKKHNVYVWCNEGEIYQWFVDAGAKTYKKQVNVTFGIDIDIKYIWDLVKFLKQNKIDVIHSHELRAVANSLIAGFLARTKVRISHIHTPFSEWPISKQKKLLYTKCYSIAIAFFATKEVAITQSRYEVKVKEGINKNKLVVIPNGINTKKFQITNNEKTKYKNEIIKKYQIPQNKFYFGNVSRYTQEKGHAVLIKAYKKFLSKTKDTNTHLILAGGGELENQLKDLAKSLNIFDRITFTGRFSQQDHLKIFCTFDAFIFPSLAEGFGLVLAEAMAAKLPVICSNLEVLHEVGDDCVFSYFEEENDLELSNKMIDLYNKKDQLDNYIEKGYQRVNNLYSLEIFVQNYLDLYIQLLK